MYFFGYSFMDEGIKKMSIVFTFKSATETDYYLMHMNIFSLLKMFYCKL